MLPSPAGCSCRDAPPATPPSRSCPGSAAGTAHPQLGFPLFLWAGVWLETPERRPSHRCRDGSHTPAQRAGSDQRLGLLAADSGPAVVHGLRRLFAILHPFAALVQGSSCCELCSSCRDRALQAPPAPLDHLLPQLPPPRCRSSRSDVCPASGEMLNSTRAGCLAQQPRLTPAQLSRARGPSIR